MKHVVMFSGGVASWLTAKRVADSEGTDNLVLLFADTKIEDEDLYRFINEAAANVGGEFVKIGDGRTPWEVFNDVSYLGNSRVDPCSRILKRDLMRKWVEDNCDSKSTVIYLGLDWTEEHRLKKAQPLWKPWQVKAPLLDPPLLFKEEILEALSDEGIEVPRLYKMGFPHNNCGGFCVKAGQGNFKLLLKNMPERYRWHEEREQKIREKLGDVTILRDWRNDGAPMTLKEFRERVEEGAMVDETELGGCGCAIS